MTGDIRMWCLIQSFKYIINNTLPQAKTVFLKSNEDIKRAIRKWGFVGAGFKDYELIEMDVGHQITDEPTEDAPGLIPGTYKARYGVTR